MLGSTRRVHFVGIGGIGMSGIAELLANLGYEVTGSDAATSDITDRLASQLGVRIHQGHAADQVGDADVVVFSSAVRPANPEIVEARRRGIPIIPRAEMLAELMRLRFSVAVAGAHGKTTTSSMIALMLDRAGLDPTAIIGGRLSAFGSNARLGRGKYLVAEADESDRSFLLLSPDIAVITNIDYEHMESYASFEGLQQAFVDFANKVPFYGAVVACADDEGVSAVLPRFTRRVVTYGLSAAGAQIIGTDVELGAFGGRCLVHRRKPGPQRQATGQSAAAGLRPRAALRWTDRGSAGAPGPADGHGAETTMLGELRLPAPGRHNLQNALAAVAVAEELGIDFAAVASTMADFQGVERRFQRCGEAAGVLVVDDYGHHPREIEAVLTAARATLGRRLVVAFQPHRFTRTQRLLEQFGPALQGADEVVLTDIYAAGEDPIPGVTLDALAAAMRRAGRSVRVARTLSEVVPTLMDLVRSGDAVLTLGAGSIGTVPKVLLAELGRRGAPR